MSFQSHQADLFGAAAAPEQAELPLAKPMPATQKQIDYAKALAAKTKSTLPAEFAADRARLSRWIDAHKPAPSKFNDYPSSKQVGFAERLARKKRETVPAECFRDRALMSRWIDSHLPR